MRMIGMGLLKADILRDDCIENQAAEMLAELLLHVVGNIRTLRNVNLLKLPGIVHTALHLALTFEILLIA